MEILRLQRSKIVPLWLNISISYLDDEDPILSMTEPEAYDQAKLRNHFDIRRVRSLWIDPFNGMSITSLPIEHLDDLIIQQSEDPSSTARRRVDFLHGPGIIFR